MTRSEILTAIVRKELNIEPPESTGDDVEELESLYVADVWRALVLAYDSGLSAGRQQATDDTATANDPAAAPIVHEPTFQPELVGVAHHRNGIDGAPFDVVLFNDAGRFPGLKLGVAFEAKRHVAVFDMAKLAAGDIAFGSNSWRGDQYESRLRSMIVAWSEGADGPDE